MIEADEQFDLPVRAAPETSTLILQLGSWEGPLDLLLTLARAQKVDLAQISILALVDQYLGFIRDAKALSLELAADYLVMAAWLAYLKSLLLLPKDPEAEPDPAELALKLQFQLQRLEAMRESGQKLLARPQLGVSAAAPMLDRRQLAGRVVVSASTLEEVLEGVALHIRKFWVPRMRQRFLARAREGGLAEVGDGVDCRSSARTDIGQAPLEHVSTGTPSPSAV